MGVQMLKTHGQPGNKAGDKKRKSGVLHIGRNGAVLCWITHQHWQGRSQQRTTS
jgi:hypothetical protein